MMVEFETQDLASQEEVDDALDRDRSDRISDGGIYRILAYD